MAKRTCDGERGKFWRDVLARFGSSGLSVRAFCRQEQLREPLFYSWRRTIAERDGSQPTVRQAAEPRGALPPVFLPVVLPPQSLSQPASGISLVLRGGRTLQLPESTSVERLAELIRVLESMESAS